MESSGYRDGVFVCEFFEDFRIIRGLDNILISIDDGLFGYVDKGGNMFDRILDLFILEFNSGVSSSVG